MTKIIRDEAPGRKREKKRAVRVTGWSDKMGLRWAFTSDGRLGGCRNARSSHVTFLSYYLLQTNKNVENTKNILISTQKVQNIKKYENNSFFYVSIYDLVSNSICTLYFR